MTTFAADPQNAVAHLASEQPDFSKPLPSRDGDRLIQFREALREALSEEMRRDERIFLMGEEVAQYNGAYKVSQGMLDEFGEKRIIDSPISENGFAGLAVGAAMYGLRPVVFRGNDGAGGQLGSPHSWCVEGLYSNVPGVKIAIPSNPYDAKGLLKTAIRDDDPVFFLESERMLGDKGHVPEEEYYIPFGKAHQCREGSDCTLISFGRPVHFCMEAAERLAAEGIECDVLDMRTIRPLDIDAIVESVKKTNRIVVVDQCWPFASVASEVCTQVIEHAFDYLDHQTPNEVCRRCQPLSTTRSTTRSSVRKRSTEPTTRWRRRGSPRSSTRSAACSCPSSPRSSAIG